MSAIARALLKWYDANARVLPWRVGPKARKAGERPDPYRVWLSEIMLQQTTVATVRPRFDEFLQRWPTIKAMAAAPIDDILGQWAGLGYYARARNLHKCAREVAAMGDFPDTEETLGRLPGIGSYTAAAIAAIAFDRRAVVVDGNVERVAARLFAVKTPLPKAKAELKTAIAEHWPQKRSGDFAQSLMDLGAGVCTPRNPKCLSCPLQRHCEAHAKGIAQDLPRKAKGAKKPTRRGVAYALINAKGEVLFERRPEKGLLGGMLGLPGSAWIAIDPLPLAGEGGAKRRVRGNETPLTPDPSDAWSDPASGRGEIGKSVALANWRRVGTVTHTFTHFHLELDVMAAPAPRSFRAGPGQVWIRPEDARLPSVMKKATVAAVAGERPS